MINLKTRTKEGGGTNESRNTCKDYGECKRYVCRGSHRRRSIKKMLLKIWQNSQGNSLFLIKSQAFKEFLRTAACVFAKIENEF